MTDQDIAHLGPAFASFLRRFRPYFLQERTARHFDNYCRGLLSDLNRKSVEPIALASGCAVRTLQEFLRDHHWRHTMVTEQLQSLVAALLPSLPDDGLGPERGQDLGRFDPTKLRSMRPTRATRTGRAGRF